MKVGVPTEIKADEYRVALTPSGVRELSDRGHEVVVQAGAGEGSAISDADYAAQGARVLPDADAVFAEAELIVKVKEPQAEEIGRLEARHTLFTYLHLAPDPELTEALRRAERDRDHVLRQVLAVAHAGIVSGIDDVDERALADDLEIDLRTSPHERHHHRRQHQVDRRRRGVDAQASRGHAAQAAHLIDCLADILHRRRNAGQQQLASFGERNAARGAVHQANAEPLFHVAQPLAEARDGNALFGRGPAEILGARDGDESTEVAEVEILHCSIY